MSTDGKPPVALIDALEGAAKALERLRGAREEAMGEYSGEGPLVDCEASRLRLRAGYGELRRAINALELGTDQVKTVRELGEGNLMPDALVDAYEFLHTQVFGGARVPPEAGVGEIGPAEQWLVKSDGQKRRGPAKRGKQYSASVRGVIRDERALELKKRVDKRLRKMARDIYREWKGLEEEEQAKCFSCHKLAESGWKWCPRCGDRLTR